MTLKLDNWRREDSKDNMHTVTLALRHCRKCGDFKQPTGGKYVRGKSRYELGYFTCHQCLTINGANS